MLSTAHEMSIEYRLVGGVYPAFEVVCVCGWRASPTFMEQAQRVYEEHLRDGGDSVIGHGWVTPTPDGAKARCGGPPVCSACAREARLAGFEMWNGAPLRAPGPTHPVSAPDSEYGDEVARLLHGTTDAQAWAAEFMRVDAEHGIHSDEGAMIGWFANAIEVGRNAGQREQGGTR